MCQVCPVVLWALLDQMGIGAIARWVSVGTEEMVFVPLEDAVRTGGCFGVGAGKWGGLSSC